MRYAWVSLAILAIWISATLLLVVEPARIIDGDVFYLFVMITTVALSYIGFRSA